MCSVQPESMTQSPLLLSLLAMLVTRSVTPSLFMPDKCFKNRWYCSLVSSGMGLEPGSVQTAVFGFPFSFFLGQHSRYPTSLNYPSFFMTILSIKIENIIHFCLSVIFDILLKVSLDIRISISSLERLKRTRLKLISFVT